MQIITSLEELRQKAVGYQPHQVAGELFSDVQHHRELTYNKMSAAIAFIWRVWKIQENLGRYTFLIWT